VRHLLDQPGHVRSAGPLDHFHLPLNGEILKNGRLRSDAGVIEEPPDFVDLQFVGEGFRDRGRVQQFAERLHLVLVVVFEHQADFGSEEGMCHRHYPRQP